MTTKLKYTKEQAQLLIDWQTCCRLLDQQLQESFTKLVAELIVDNSKDKKETT